MVDGAEYRGRRSLRRKDLALQFGRQRSKDRRTKNKTTNDLPNDARLPEVSEDVTNAVRRGQQQSKSQEDMGKILGVDDHWRIVDVTRDLEARHSRTLRSLGLWA